MTHLIPPALLAAATAGTTEVSAQLLEHQSVGLTTLCSIAVCVFLAGLWLEHRFTRIEDTLHNLPCECRRRCDREDSENGKKK